MWPRRRNRAASAAILLRFHAFAGGHAKRGGGSSSSASVAAVLAAVLGGAVSAQEVPRTSWGDPDLKGIWVGSTLTPLERPSEYEGREFLSEEEVAALENAALVHEERLLARPAERALAGGMSTTGPTAASATTPSGSTRAPLGSRVGARR